GSASRSRLDFHGCGTICKRTRAPHRRSTQNDRLIENATPPGTTEWQRDVAKLVRYQQGVGKSGWIDRRRPRPQLPQYWLDCLPLAAVNRKPTGANGR